MAPKPGPVRDCSPFYIVRTRSGVLVARSARVGPDTSGHAAVQRGHAMELILEIVWPHTGEPPYTTMGADTRGQSPLALALK